jgi:putative ABC transport system ATP-binding protein
MSRRAPRADSARPAGDGPAIEVTNVSKTFGHGELAVRALKPCSFSIGRGELAALLGPSGSGKSTLLLSISLILDPTSGRIVIDGQTVYDDGPTGVDARAFRRRHIGFVFQQHNLIPFLTAQENVALVLQLNGATRRDAARQAKDLLGYLEIGHRAGSLPAALSGGEQQRVAIGRALANEPPLILADEPTAALDTERGTKVMTLLRRIARERGSAVITVTHDHRMIEGFDSVYELDDGRLARRTAGALSRPPPAAAAAAPAAR